MIELVMPVKSFASFLAAGGIRRVDKKYYIFTVGALMNYLQPILLTKANTIHNLNQIVESTRQCYWIPA